MEVAIPSFLKGKQVRTLDESDKRRCLEPDCKAEGHLVKDCVIRKWKNDKREKHGKDTTFVGFCSYLATLEEASQEEGTELIFAQSYLDPCEMGLDTMAGVSVMSNPAFLKNTAQDERGITLVGVGGTQEVTHRGEVVGIEGLRAWRGSSGGPNIISFLELAKIAEIKWDQEKMSFSATIGGVLYKWVAKGHVFVCDMSSLVHEGREYSLSTETAETRRQLHTKRQVAAADLAVERSRDNYGRSLRQIRGATKRRKQHRVGSDTRGVAGLMRRIRVTRVRLRAHGHVMPAVLDHIHQLRIAGFTVTAVHSDGEGAIMRMAENLPDGVVHVPRAKEEHVSEIEPKIRQVKVCRAPGVYKVPGKARA